MYGFDLARNRIRKGHRWEDNIQVGLAYIWCEDVYQIWKDFNYVRLCLISLFVQGPFELYLCHNYFFVYTVMLQRVFQTFFRLVEHIHIMVSVKHLGNLIFEWSYWWKI
jgi:hypothetical protein